MQKLVANKYYQIPQLNQYIESVRVYSNHHYHESEDILFEGYPEGVFELVIQNDQPVWQRNCNDSNWHKLEAAFVCGLHKQSFQLKIPPKSEFTSVRFKHGAFKYLFSGRLNDFINQTVPIVDLWNHEGKVLHDSFKNTLSTKQRLILLADFIDSKISTQKQSIIDGCVKQILNHKGMMDLIQLERSSRLSSAQFRKRFREEVGLPPKKFIKVIKIKSILTQLELYAGKKSLTEIVYDFEYFDQSHFIRDFKSVIGVTPSQFIATRTFKST